MVVDGGNVAGMGNHSKIMEKNGIYAQMFESQKSWYEGGYMIATIIFSVLAVFCLGYYIIMVSYAGLHTAFASVWLAAVICFFAGAVISQIIVRKQIRVPAGVRTGMLAFFCLTLVLFLAVEGLIVSAMAEKPEKNLDYVIVLGAQVRGTRITKSLRKRLEAACDYLEENKDTVAVVSGGQGKGEDLSEAQCMKDYLTERGISEERIIMEDKSTNTDENIEFSMEKIREHAGERELKLGIVTNNFHVYRTKAVCAKKGYQVQGIAAESDQILFLNYMVREFFAVVKYKAAGEI